MLTLGTTMLAVGIWQLLQQHDATRGYVPVAARVRSAELVEDRVRTKQGELLRYRPIIRYEYSVGDAIYTGNRLSAVAESFSRADAEALVSRYPTGSDVVAFVKPSDPSQSVLLRLVSFKPYGLTMFGPLLLVAGLRLLFVNERRSGEPTRGEGRWHVLPPPMKLSTQRNLALLALLVFVLTALAPLHYFTSGGKPTTTALSFTAIYAIGTLAMAHAALRQVRLSAALGEPRVLVDPTPLQRGQRNRVRLVLPLRPGRKLRGVTLRLCCVEIDPPPDATGRSIPRRVLYERAETTLADATASDGPLHADVSFTPPAEHPASSSTARRGRPRVVWELHATVELPGVPRWYTTWDITVM
jgi:hypothetical protein